MNRRAQNCIFHWLPKISPYVPTPRTSLLRLPGPERDLWGLLDGKAPPSWWGRFLERLAENARSVSQAGPWFLRTGVFSGKHRWRECCAVTDLDRLDYHVANLFEFSQMVDMMGLPCDVWAVREWLPGPALCEYAPFLGMPIRREFRAFAEAGKVVCVHPYWPAGALEKLTPEQSMQLEIMNGLDDTERVRELAAEASKCVEGAWSIDCLDTDCGWYVTDMAIAESSYHWPDCPENRWNPRPHP